MKKVKVHLRMDAMDARFNMESSNKEVLTNSVLYTIGNILLKFFSFLLIPLYTSYLSPTQYGEINLSLGFTNVVSCFIMCGLQTGVIRFYADCKGNKKKISEMFGTAITFVSIISIVIASLLGLSHIFWIKLIFENISFFPIVLLTILISSVVAIYGVYQEFLKGSHQAKKSVILSYTYFILLLTSNVVTIIVLKLGVRGVLSSIVVVNFIMLLCMIIDLRRNNMFFLGIKINLLKEMLRYSLPLVPHSLSYNISNFYTRVIINAKVSTSMLGLYSLASQFGGVADVVCNSVQSAFQPWLFERLRLAEDGNKDVVKEIKKLTNQLLWIYGLIYLLIGAWTQEAIEFLSEKAYYSAWEFVPYLIFAVAIKSPLYFYQNIYYFYKDKTKYIFTFTLLGCITSMLLVWLLTPIYGIWGAIIGDIGAVCVRVILTIWHGGDFISRVYSISHILIITIVSMVWLGITIFPSYFGWLQGIQNIIYKTLLILLYGVVFWFLYIKNLQFIKTNRL